MTPFSGQKWQWTIAHERGNGTMEFAAKGSGVTIQVTGAQHPVQGLWSMNEDGTFLVVAASGYGWWNIVWTGSVSGTSGNGQYFGYEHPINLAYLEPFTMNLES